MILPSPVKKVYTGIQGGGSAAKRRKSLSDIGLSMLQRREEDIFSFGTLLAIPLVNIDWRISLNGSALDVVTGIVIEIPVYFFTGL